MLAALRLSVVFTLLGLLTSRVALMLHELLGHALPAKLLGSDPVSWELFWFAGGYVSFPRQEAYQTSERLILSLGGIAVEFVLAAVCLVAARRLTRGSLARFAILAFASAVLLHALYYLTTGTFHGYGDGWLLHRELGSARPWLVAVGCALCLASALAVGRWLATELRGWLREHRRPTRMLMIIGATLIASAVHGGLAYTEVQLRNNRTYSTVLQPQGERDAERELARYLAMQRASGAVLERRAIADKRSELREQHQRFPLRIVLGIALFLAALFGMWPRLADGDDHDAARGPPPNTYIVYLAAATAGSVAIVIAVNALSG